MHKFVSACVFVSVLIVTPFSMKLSFTVWIKNSFILKKDPHMVRNKFA